MADLNKITATTATVESTAIEVTKNIETSYTSLTGEFLQGEHFFTSCDFHYDTTPKKMTVYFSVNTGDERSATIAVKNGGKMVGKLDLIQRGQGGGGSFSWDVPETQPIESYAGKAQNTYTNSFETDEVKFYTTDNWITISSEYSSAVEGSNVPYEVNVEQNDTGGIRTGHVYAYTGSNVTVGAWTIQQAGSGPTPGYSFSWIGANPENIDSTGKALSKSYTNTYPSITFVTNDSWIHLPSTHGNPLSITVEANTDTGTRTGYVYAQYNGSTVQGGILTIEQQGTTPSYSFSWIGANPENIDSTGKTFSKEYTNTYPTITFVTRASDSWISLQQLSTPGSPLSITINPKTDSGERTGYVYAQYNGETVPNGTLTIEQQGTTPSELYFRFDNHASEPSLQSGYTSAVTSYINTTTEQETGTALIKTNYGYNTTQKPVIGEYKDANIYFSFDFQEGIDYVEFENDKPKVSVGPAQSEFFPAIIFYLKPNDTPYQRTIVVNISSNDPNDGGDWGPYEHATLTITQIGRQPYYFVWKSDSATGGTPYQFNEETYWSIDHTTTNNEYDGAAQDFAVSFAPSAVTNTVDIEFLTNIFMDVALGTGRTLNVCKLTIVISDESGNSNEYYTQYDERLTPGTTQQLDDVDITMVCKTSGQSLRTSNHGAFYVRLPVNEEYVQVDHTVKAGDETWYKNRSKVYHIYLRKEFSYFPESGKLPGINNNNNIYDDTSYIYWMSNNGTPYDQRNNFMRWNIIQKPNGTILAKDSEDTRPIGSPAKYVFLKDNTTAATYTVSASDIYNAFPTSVIEGLKGFGHVMPTTMCDYFRDYERIHGTVYMGDFVAVRDKSGGINITCLSGVTNSSTAIAFFGHNTGTTQKTGEIHVKYYGPPHVRQNEVVTAQTVTKYWNWDPNNLEDFLHATIEQDANPFSFGTIDDITAGDTFTWCKQENVTAHTFVPTSSITTTVPSDRLYVSFIMPFTTKYIKETGEHDLVYVIPNKDKWNPQTRAGWIHINTDFGTGLYWPYDDKYEIVVHQWIDNYGDLVVYDQQNMVRNSQILMKHSSNDVGALNITQYPVAGRNVKFVFPNEYKLKNTGTTASIEGAILEMTIKAGSPEGVCAKYSGTIGSSETVLTQEAGSPGYYEHTWHSFDELHQNLHVYFKLIQNTATETNPSVHIVDSQDSWLIWSSTSARHFDFTIDGYSDEPQLMLEDTVLYVPRVKDQTNGWWKYNSINDEFEIAEEGYTGNKYRPMFRDEDISQLSGDDVIFDNGVRLDSYDYVKLFPEPSDISDGYNGTIGLAS